MGGLVFDPNDRDHAGTRMTTTARTFVGEEVVLDGHTYDGCTFERCELVFNGATPTVLTNNHIIDCGASTEAPRWRSPSRALVDGGAADLVRATLGLGGRGPSEQSAE